MAVGGERQRGKMAAIRHMMTVGRDCSELEREWNSRNYNKADMKCRVNTLAT